MISISENATLRARKIPELKWDFTIKEIIQQEVIIILNVYEAKKRGLKKKTFLEMLTSTQ